MLEKAEEFKKKKLFALLLAVILRLIGIIYSFLLGYSEYKYYIDGKV